LFDELKNKYLLGIGVEHYHTFSFADSLWLVSENRGMLEIKLLWSEKM